MLCYVALAGCYVDQGSLEFIASDRLFAKSFLVSHILIGEVLPESQDEAGDKAAS